jgi:hypothetical protein
VDLWGRCPNGRRSLQSRSGDPADADRGILKRSRKLAAVYAGCYTATTRSFPQELTGPLTTNSF